VHEGRYGYAYVSRKARFFPLSSLLWQEAFVHRLGERPRALEGEPFFAETGSIAALRRA
jgi:hypothetical protein